MYMYCIERSANIIITRITRVNKICFCHVAISDDISTCIALRGVLTSLLQESQGLIKYAFVMLLLAMISLHMLTFRLMVTMVAEFCSL